MPVAHVIGIFVRLSTNVQDNASTLWYKDHQNRDRLKGEDKMDVTSDGLYELLALMALTVLIVVFVADTIGNLIVFDNRFWNALVTGLVFLLLFGAAYYFVGDFDAPGLVAVGAFLVFCADLVSNALVFNNRFANALLTALITIATLGSIIYFLLAG